MTSRPSPIDLSLSHDACPAQRDVYHLKGRTCQKCENRAAPVVEAPRSMRLEQRKADGSQHETALYAALDANGYMDIRYATPNAGYLHIQSYYQRGFPWGLYLTPRRKFQADAAFPASDLLVEIEGTAHKIGTQRKHDVLRRQLAEGAGWRVLSVLPEQVRDGTAIELVKAALAAKEA